MRIKLGSLALMTILLSGCSIASATQIADAPITPITITVTTPDVAAAEAAVAEHIGRYVEAVQAQEARQAQQRRQATSATRPNYDPGNGSRWDQLALCEAGGDWARNSGNGFGGGLQFMHQSSYSTWLSFGGGEFARHPWEASREQQIIVAERVLASSGWNAWPGCSRKYGWL